MHNMQNPKKRIHTVDEDHYLISADVTDASYVRRDYWNEDKKQFQPTKEQRGGTNVFPPPYMAFFGSQSFGYIVTHDRYPNEAYIVELYDSLFSQG